VLLAILVGIIAALLALVMSVRGDDAMAKTGPVPVVYIGEPIGNTQVCFRRQTPTIGELVFSVRTTRQGVRPVHWAESHRLVRLLPSDDPNQYEVRGLNQRAWITIETGEARLHIGHDWIIMKREVLPEKAAELGRR